MNYAPDLPAAARRHLAAADALAAGPCWRVAGYLYGIAAECAVKAMMCEAGLPRCEDAFYAHFPELRSMLRERLIGRRSGPLRKFIEDDSFMHHWDIRMRYCKGNEIQDTWVRAWQQKACDVVAAMGS